MKKINFKKLQASHFLSLGDLVEIDFSDDGFFVVNGINHDDRENSSNGTGKTTLFTAIEFALYGVAKGLTKAQIPNNKGGKKKCVTSLDFDVTDNDVIVSYKVVRGINPSCLVLTKNGEDISQSSAVSTQEHLDSILGIPYNVFLQTISMKLNESTPFMAMKKVARDEFVNTVFDLSVFREIEKAARSEYNALDKECAVAASEAQGVESQVRLVKEQHDSYQEKLTKEINQLEYRLTEFDAEIKETESKRISDKDKLAEDVTRCSETEKVLDDKMGKIKDSLTKTSEVRKNIRQKIEELEKEKRKLDDAVCPTCKRIYDGQSDTTAAKAEKVLAISEQKTKLTTLTETTEKLEKAQDKVAVNQKKNQREVNALADLIKADKAVESELEKIEAGREQVQTMCDEKKKDDGLVAIVDKLEKLGLEKDTKTKIYDDLIESKTVLEHIKFITGKEGVKPYLLKKLIGFFNKKLAEYLVKLEAPCLVSFDENFDPLITNGKNKEVPYLSFSGGEKKRIDLSVAFAFKDILRIQNSISFNVCVYDEILDSSLDSRGIETVVTILEENRKKTKENVYLISHRSDLDIDGSTRLLLEKRDGLTSIAA